MFYLLSILFIIKNIFYIFNREKLDNRFYQKYLLSMSPFFFSYYLLSVIYPFWIIFGLFTEYENLFYILLLINLLKFPIYHISNNLYTKYLKVYPILSITTLIILLYTKLF